MASIRVRSGKLFVDFRYQGIRCRETTFLNDTPTNQKKLNAIMDKMEAEITLGIFDYAAYFPKSPKADEMTQLKERVRSVSSNVPTFSKFSQIWLSEKQVEWRNSYKRKVATTIGNYLLPYFGVKPMNLIVKADLLAFRASLGKVKYGKKPR
ncbi:MAG: DUF3596 domain-containing protein [Candidatus Saccharibacteria bacterium]|nr:DUF3596 domain-containing protein [Moraxellaceae bacterium]